MEEIKITLLIGSANNEAMVFGYINAKAIVNGEKFDAYKNQMQLKERPTEDTIQDTIANVISMSLHEIRSSNQETVMVEWCPSGHRM